MALYVRDGELVVAEFESDDITFATRPQEGLDIPEGAELVRMATGAVLATYTAAAGWALTGDGTVHTASDVPTEEP
jgi:hypothetical protein